MKTMISAAVILGLLSMPALASHRTEAGASDPATQRVTLIASSSGDTVYGPGYTAPIHDGWG